MKTFPPSIFNAYNICKREAWLMYRNLSADQYNEFLEIGRLIDKEAFRREKKKIYLADIEAMIDMIIKEDNEYLIAEIKKSSKTLKSGIFQLKYYLYLLKYERGIVLRGIIKIPKERISKSILLTKKDERKIENILVNMNIFLQCEKIPRVNKQLTNCSKCGHFEFCWS